MEKEEEKVIGIVMPKIENTCRKCLYGNVINPNYTSCAKFENKPSEIFYEGKDCPYFKALRGKK